MARGEVTIAVHNGADVATGHNLRDPEICKHEPHIDPNGIHEIWHHEELREFYGRTFGAAQREYDNKARACRRIGDYLDSITRDAAEAEDANKEIRERNKAHKAAGEKLEKLKVAKKPVYEIIAGIYPQGDLELTEQESRDALRLWVFGDGTDEHKSWEERNPGLKLVGVYYHADEPDARPHVHIDYVPVAECSRGMRLQNSLEGALNAGGMVSGVVECADGQKRLKTAQEQFTDSERDGLQAICEEMGLDVLHPQRGSKTRHKSTAEKKRETRAAELDAERNAMLDEVRQEVQEEEARLQRWADKLDERGEALDKRTDELDKKEKALEGREKAVEAREAALSEIEAQRYQAALKAVPAASKTPVLDVMQMAKDEAERRDREQKAAAKRDGIGTWKRR